MSNAKAVARRVASVSAFILLLTPCAWVQGEETPEGVNSQNVRSLWPVPPASSSYQALVPGIGFSFVYDGKEVGPEVPSGWQVSSRSRAGGVETAFRGPSGLVVVRRSRALPDSDAVEYALRFKNDSRSVLPALASVNVLDIAFQGELAKGISVVHSGGGKADAAFPPKDFALGRTSIGPAPKQDRLTLSSEGGMPSSRDLPFFFVENQEKNAGVYLGIGWTGSWEATVRAADDGNTVRIQAAMSDVHLQLNPGEEISAPKVLVGFFQGPLHNGAGALRRVIRDHYAPTVNGRRLVAPVLYTTWFDVGAELDEKLFRILVDNAAEIGQEIFLMDAGWYKGVPTCRYGDMRATWDAISHPLGNWEQGEELSRFPSGLPALADYVRSKGMQFGLWFELERVGPQSLLATRHPDWVIFLPNRKWGLVDFGKQEVQDYFCKILHRYIRDLDLRYIRWDCNVEDAPPYWASRDAPDRRGITEIRHVEGVHRVEEFVRKNHPNVILESCAGGGRRIDLATLQRRHTIWISDQTMDPQIVRFHLEGLNHFLPGSAQMVAFAPRANTYRKPESAFPDVAYQCCFAGAFGSAGRLHEWPQAMKEQMRKHVDVFKEIRRFLSEDYYPLVPQPRSLRSWSGWQFHDPRADEGFVQAFRIHAPERTMKFVLHGLDPNSQYRFTDPYTGGTFQVAGAGLVSEGLEVALPEMSSRVLMYRRSNGK